MRMMDIPFSTGRVCPELNFFFYSPRPLRASLHQSKQTFYKNNYRKNCQTWESRVRRKKATTHDQSKGRRRREEKREFFAHPPPVIRGVPEGRKSHGTTRPLLPSSLAC